MNTKKVLFPILALVLVFGLGIASAAGQIEVDKEYTYTDVCFEKDNDGDGLFNEDPVDFYYIDNDGDLLIDEDPIDGIDNDGDLLIDEDPAEPIDNDGDLLFNEDPVDCPGPDGTPVTYLGTLLPIDPVTGNYIVEAVVHKNGKVSSYNPGQYYAVSTVNVLEDVDSLTIVEDWCDCTGISALNPKNGGGCVVIVQVVGGVAYQIRDAKSPEVTVDDVSGCMATATLGAVPAGTTILMYVKFGPAMKGEMWDPSIEPCENINAAEASIGGLPYYATHFATLELIEKV